MSDVSFLSSVYPLGGMPKEFWYWLAVLTNIKDETRQRLQDAVNTREDAGIEQALVGKPKAKKDYRLGLCRAVACPRNGVWW